ncbi:hypothetical protein N7532_002474 [Penicillium argentinense]|uniref:Uncharacterized protein n=1 Tax=Penicillium argentinense TaxID=1131581 RepID=A0A9W9KKB0_9EURO|nr:uncharacterized protein N7532_002474 [Penicillium argentinense]KAJ5109829.1 hypothetical protein N7532_002474 [Penicillium argentinense]
MSNPRLLINRESIYERQLPGDAYITAYVQRLQHGYYSSPAVSDNGANNVDFLALSFVFHSPHTLTHRFKSATIRASIEGADQPSTSTDENSRPKHRPKNPRFLMHAPHLIYGTVSPETMEWTFSLAGSIGISETPISANLIPSGSMNSRYRRYEMMRIQGSARTLKSPRGREFDAEAAEIVWSLEENNLQRSGLPREFTFVMLIQKYQPNDRMKLTLEIDPVIQSWYGSYPSWLLGFSSYQPVKRDIDFNREIGQRFEPADGVRGFNFASLVNQFDDYIAMPGRKYSRRMEIPSEPNLPDQGSFHPGYPGQYGSINPNQGVQQGMQTLQQMQSTGQTQGSGAQTSLATFSAAPTFTTNLPSQANLPTQAQPSFAGIQAPLTNTTTNNNLNLSLGPSHGIAIMNPSALRSAMTSPPCTRHPQTTNASTKSNTSAVSDHSNPNKNNEDKYEEAGAGEWPPLSGNGPGVDIETIRSSMLRSVHWTSPPEDGCASDDDTSEAPKRIMNMENRPLTPSLLLTEKEAESLDVLFSVT